MSFLYQRIIQNLDLNTIIVLEKYINLDLGAIIILQDYSLNIFLRQTWIDPRLNISLLSNISSLELDQKRMQDVWVPDTYFRNEESATFHKVTVPNKLLHINNNGLVTYSLRFDCVVFLFKAISENSRKPRLSLFTCTLYQPGALCQLWGSIFNIC